MPLVEDSMSKLTATSFSITRRKFLIGSACVAASLPAVAMAAPAKEANVSKSSNQ
jgi:hypothetical protein